MKKPEPNRKKSFTTKDIKKETMRGVELCYFQDPHPWVCDPQMRE